MSYCQGSVMQHEIRVGEFRNVNRPSGLSKRDRMHPAHYSTSHHTHDVIVNHNTYHIECGLSCNIFRQSQLIQI